MASFAQQLLLAWEALQDLSRDGAFTVDGHSLTVPQVVAISQSASRVDINQSVRDRISASITGLQDHLTVGNVVYGVNTGFGGSADTHTDDYAKLQHSLLQVLNCGILTRNDMDGKGLHEYGSQSMPTPWVKGAMLIRCNSLIRGHSGVRYEVLEVIMALIDHTVTPIIPLRGSISASGDLSPLSYIAGVLEANPDIYVQFGEGSNQRIISSDKALELLGRSPIKLRPKEGLGLVNGTAVCTSVASLALWEANHLAVLSQACTAMATEALRGHAESFHPFIAEVRPHPGQIEAARNIYGFLTGSRLAKGANPIYVNGMPQIGRELPVAVSHNILAQDRYAIRTASQWIGPQLEDLLLAHQQIYTELNATTDNPLIDMTSGVPRFFNGGNFQAASITSAMEKTRSALQMLGKMIFAQCTEIIDPAFNNGLPANLAADDPSLSFTCKGIDISMAAYMSELAYLANPVSTHVQSAEMHNQAINSLALVSARKTMEAVDIMSMMCASYLYVLCQALDLRTLTGKFIEAAKEKVRDITARRFQACCYNLQANDQVEEFADELWKIIAQNWELTGANDLRDRCEKAVAATASVFLQGCIGGRLSTENDDHMQHLVILEWQENMKKELEYTYNRVRTEVFQHHTRLTADHVGQGSSKVYSFIREELGVPMHRGLADAPTAGDTGDRKKLTVGSWVSIIYEALRDGRLHRPIMECIKENEERFKGV